MTECWSKRSTCSSLGGCECKMSTFCRMVRRISRVMTTLSTSSRLPKYASAACVRVTAPRRCQKRHLSSSFLKGTKKKGRVHHAAIHDSCVIMRVKENRGKSYSSSRSACRYCGAFFLPSSLFLARSASSCFLTSAS